jgi:hypothetical protein
MNVNLHIERLVLDGIELTSDQQPVLTASLTAELTRVLADGALGAHLAQGATLSRLSVGGAQWSTGNPQQLGQQIAQSVYRGLGPGGD